jgi:hypothetical protein
MEEDFILFGTAILARAKGFDWHCDWRYDEKLSGNPRINWKDVRVEEAFHGCEGYEYKSLERLKELYYDKFDNNDIGWYVSAPTQALLKKWLNKVHQIEVEVISYNVYDPQKRQYEVLIYGHGVTWSGYDTYEEALEMGLIQGLTLIKDKL